MMQAKQRGALEIYVGMEARRHGQTVNAVIDATLKAARMKPDKLYAYIRRFGYKWSVSRQRWSI